MKHVQHVRGKWVVRVTVPEELRAILGKRELVENDLPNDSRARERKAIGVINGFYAQIDEARERFEAQKSNPQAALSEVAKAHYAGALATDERKRAALPDMAAMQAEHSRLLDQIGKGEIGISHGFETMINATTDYELMVRARGFYVGHRTRRLEALRRSFTSGDTRWIEPVVQQYVDERKLDITPGSAEWRDLADALTRAEIEALERTIERDRGDYAGLPRDPLLTMPDLLPNSSSAKAPEGAGMTLSEALSAFHKERTAGGSTLAPKTMEEHKNAVRMFNEFMGGEVAVRLITKRNVIDYKQALLETPNRYTMRFPGLTLPRAIKANAKLAEPFATLAPKTINMKWLSHLSSVLQWASNNGHIEINPAHGIRVDTGSSVHKEPSYLPFDREELKQIFGHAMFAEPEKYELRQWATLVMLYTGVRNSSEMSRMNLENIYEEQGVPVFYLAEASKNQRSKRLVPIHNDLIKLGLFDYIKTLRAKGETRLFPDWEPSDKVNNWFNVTFLRRTLKISSRQKVFYSFRHTLSTELARSGCPRELSKMITGHANQEVASVYIHASPVTLMAEALNRVSFGLPIKALKTVAGTA
ncbi:tyrosine-type recombinase/integrase [Alloyangia pacifica]|uniref:tyrosine-type recombinase/integrase n=1 Tax=Alloyangia pacifica TaxID=311180 RepID=UPI001CD3FD77|nr:tyrosine-type recombinase/integrase [Alloyangia pacifica]MCA0996296.1 tyrosine-type recombinase/integrase [Alloyangia pacifica]